MSGCVISLKDWTASEKVQIYDNNPPLDPEAATISISNIRKTTLTLNWIQSRSVDVKLYEIYDGGTLLGSAPPPYSIFQIMRFNIVDLSPNTTYTFTIKVLDSMDNRSNGVNVTVKTLGTQAISMNGVNDFLKLPSLTFTTIELMFSLDLPIPVSSNVSILDARNGIAAGYYERSVNNSDNAGASWSSIYMNGELKRTNSMIPNANVIVLQLNMTAPGTDDINIFSNGSGNQRTKGIIYYVKLFNSGILVAHYDLTSQFVGNLVADSSGNGKPVATLTGGTWITPY